MLNNVCVYYLLSTSQEISWEEHLQNDLFYIEWDVKLNSINQLCLL